MTISCIQKVYQHAAHEIRREWPLYTKACIIGLVVQCTLGKYATGVYAAAALVLHHHHGRIVHEISKITLNDLVVSVAVSVAPFFSIYGLLASGVLVIVHTISKNISLYRILGQYAATLTKLEEVEQKNSEISTRLDEATRDYTARNITYDARLKELDASEEARQKMQQECQVAFDAIRDRLDSIVENANIPVEEITGQLSEITSTLRSNHAIWLELQQRRVRQ